MTRQEICRIVGGTLVVLIGIAIGFGGFQLRNGVPQSWPDVIAADSTTRIVAKGMMALAGLLAVAGAAAIVNLGWGYLATMIAIAIFVAGGFWANYVLFGDIRPIHTGTNVIVAAVIMWLLWIGSSVPKS